MGCFGNVPDPPDPADAYRSGQITSLLTFPLQHQIEAAARLGQRITVDVPGAGSQTFDFTGLGDAQAGAAYNDRMSAQLLDLQRRLGPAFIQQRLAELQAADPEGQGLRQHQYDQIMADLHSAQSAERPTADALQQSILDELNKGGTLDPSVEREVSQGVLGSQVARGNWLGNAAASEEAGVLTRTSEDTAAQRKQAALAFLTSGATPEDVNYKRQQQAFANLGSFAAGQSPTAQFGQLSGAANGAVPFEGGAPLAGIDRNAGAGGVGFANSVFGTQSALANNTVNPWLAGLTGGAQGATLWAALQRQ